MEDLYRLDLSACSEDDMTVRVGKFSLGKCPPTASACEFHNSMLDQFNTTTGSSLSDFDLIKAQIANHPSYPSLLSVHMECQKIGAPPEMNSFFEDIRRENIPTQGCSSEIGADPELDKFMESYCGVLQNYKEEISKPFDEATIFFSNMESQLTNLCKGEILITKTLDYRSDEAGGTLDEELAYAGIENESSECEDPSCLVAAGDEANVKAMLMRKYSGYFSGLKREFLKKRKKGKLPKDAKNTLMDWWKSHTRWPYPTEEEKLKLSGETGLDQRQINNWFINQRKRHWKPAEDMRFALLEGAGISHNSNIDGEPMFFNTTD